MYKCFSMVESEFTMVMAAFSQCFSSVSRVKTAFSRHENTEAYLVARGPRRALVGSVEITADDTCKLRAPVNPAALSDVCTRLHRRYRHMLAMRASIEPEMAVAISEWFEDPSSGYGFRGQSALARLFTLPVTLLPEPTTNMSAAARPRREAIRGPSHGAFGRSGLSSTRAGR